MRHARGIHLYQLILLIGLPFAACAQDFTIIALPDTQNEAQFFPQVLASQTKWIVNNQDALNIQVVLGEGDIVNDGASTAQEQNADAAIRLLDNAGIPYLLAIGNHDYNGANPKARNVTGFNHYFGPLRYSGKAYYKGNFPSGSNENFYGVLTINGKQMLFLILEYRPRSTSLDWADQVLAANADKEAIVVTHSYLLSNGKRQDTCDSETMPAGNATGQAMWMRLRKHANVIMVLNGHWTSSQSSHRADLGDAATLVNQVFTNYQTFPNGGDGWLRIFTFHPATNSISVKTFSPFLNQFRTDSANQFTMSYHNPHANSGIGTVRGRVRNSSTCAVIAGVKVSAGGKSTLTASDGSYHLSLPPGSYNVGVSKTGFAKASKTETVNDSLTTQLNFYLTQ
jgi:carboxypeptidase family protein/calcineurin-like phosphoesterase family protein